MHDVVGLDNMNTSDSHQPPSILQLRDMAARQQQQIEQQQQLLVAKEQRLKYLKQHEFQQHHMAAEYDKLRRLRDKVEAQESKLRKLRAMRGQADQNNKSNSSLTTDLESIRRLFNEKEKELALAVTKVDDLTRQLEELRTGKLNYNYPPQVVELEKLRRELAYRRQLNEQQNNMITQQRAQLGMGQDEMSRIDRRIAELQDRLTRKRMMNQQLANQINAATSAKQAQLRAIQAGLVNNKNSNKNKPVSTVEPFQRSLPVNAGITGGGSVDNSLHVSAEDLKPAHLQNSHLNSLDLDNKNLIQESKYQTLPYNTKFASGTGVGGGGGGVSGGGGGYNKAQKIEQLKMEKENNNIGFSEGLPRPPPTVTYGGPVRQSTDYQGNYQGPGVGVVAPIPHGAVSSIASSSSGGMPTSLDNAISSISVTKPISSVAPVPTSNRAQFSSDDSGVGSAGRQGSPTKLRPALPPKPLSGGNPQQGGGENQLPVHGEEGTSVDDVEDLPPPPPTTEPPSDSPTPQNDMLNGHRGMMSGGQPDLSVAVSQISYDSSVLQVSTPSSTTALESSQNVHVSINRRIEMPPAFHFPEDEAPPSDLVSGGASGDYPPLLPRDVTDNAAMFPMVNQIYKEFQDLGMDEKEQLFSSRSPEESDEYSPETVPEFEFDHSSSAESKGVKSIIENLKKGHVKVTGQTRHNRKVTFDPLALLLDASLEGELDLVKKTATEVSNPSAANDEGITALHNAICAGHLDIVQFLVLFGCDVNAQDSDGWTPLHCAASCNNLAMVRFLVEHGACIFATTLSDHETAAEKCEEDEEGFDGCSEYLYHIQEKLGIINDGAVYAVYSYDPINKDELGFRDMDKLMVVRKGDEVEKEWWWCGADHTSAEGYVPRNLLGLYPRVVPGANQPMEE